MIDFPGIILCIEKRFPVFLEITVLITKTLVSFLLIQRKKKKTISSLHTLFKDCIFESIIFYEIDS